MNMNFYLLSFVVTLILSMSLLAILFSHIKKTDKKELLRIIGKMSEESLMLIEDYGVRFLRILRDRKDAILMVNQDKSLIIIASKSGLNKIDVSAKEISIIELLEEYKLIIFSERDCEIQTVFITEDGKKILGSSEIRERTFNPSHPVSFDLFSSLIQLCIIENIISEETQEEFLLGKTGNVIKVFNN